MTIPEGEDNGAVFAGALAGVEEGVTPPAGTDPGASPSSAAKLGAGVAVEGSCSAPAPQGMGSFDSGWVALGAATVWPDEEAIVKRVVHSLTVVPGAEYWKK